MRTPSKIVMVAMAALVGLPGCMSMGGMMSPKASAALSPRSGSTVTGNLSFVQQGDKVLISGEISGLKPNADHGFHIHEKGDCSAADATSAGGHFNPAGKAHARPGGGHAGDLTSIKADAGGVARVSLETSGVTVDSGPNGILGRSAVVHRDPDDYTSQPAGNSGPRIACGVIG